ncbi:hypothetical protein DDE74_36020 [Streptomyces lydicus]|uniref:Uncharacterized protein n=1 Tax=Streptomyces lydicus TaxID=47763 RepID=A0A3S9YL41_9ACTN|nr:hypothetical protein [Streptomyces lydicus]AZS75584.1 hypothetical protein DDE74_36020 [Streptomyces lydicus]
MSERVYLRLIADDMLPPEIVDSYEYVRPVAKGLVEALSLDLGDAVSMLRDCDVAQYGGLEKLRAAGRANLLKDPFEGEQLRLQRGLLWRARPSGPGMS